MTTIFDNPTPAVLARHLSENDVYSILGTIDPDFMEHQFEGKLALPPAGWKWSNSNGVQAVKAGSDYDQSSVYEYLSDVISDSIQWGIYLDITMDGVLARKVEWNPSAETKNLRFIVKDERTLTVK